MTIRVLHVVVLFDKREGTGRSIVEVASRLPGFEPHLCTTAAPYGTNFFSSVHEVGGSRSLFHVTRSRQIAEVMAIVRPQLTHIHGGFMVPFLAKGSALSSPVVLSIYGWPRIPAPSAIIRSSWQELRKSAVLRARVLAPMVVPPRLVGAALNGKKIKGVLTADPKLAARLACLTSVPVRLATSGATVDGLRASYEGDRPIIVFAGRAETARGADTLISAMPLVLRAFPQARLRLLLLPAPQLRAIVDLAQSLGIRHAVDIDGQPAKQLRAEFARCTLAAFPFKFDHTTATPPITVTEAMSVGLPVIGTPVRCMAPVLEPEYNGLLARIGDPASLAAAICSALKDEALWRALSRGAVETIRTRWNWDTAASTVSQLYEEVLASP